MTFKDDLITDLPIFLSSDEFGKKATYKGTEIDIQFYSPYEEASPMEMGIKSRRVWAVARASDVADAVDGDTLTVDGVDYSIKVKPGDSGLTTLELFL